jgi:hypothetical protein
MQIKHEQPVKYKHSIYFRKDLTAGGQFAVGNSQFAVECRQFEVCIKIKGARFDSYSLSKCLESYCSYFFFKRPTANCGIANCLFLFIKSHCLTGGLQQFIFFLASNNHIFKLPQPGTCWNCMTSYNVLFQS